MLGDATISVLSSCRGKLLPHLNHIDGMLLRYIAILFDLFLGHMHIFVLKYLVNR